LLPSRSQAQKERSPAQDAPTVLVQRHGDQTGGRDVSPHIPIAVNTSLPAIAIVVQHETLTSHQRSTK
jgi:hypothetical protein